MGSFSIWHWLVILAIVLLLFGTKRLRNLGSDLGGAIKGFKNAVKDESKKDEEAAKDQKTENLPHKEGEEADAGRVIEGEPVHREQEKSSDKPS